MLGATKDVSVNELRDIVDQKLKAMIREMEDADWNTADIVLAINDAIKTNWLSRLDALKEAREAMPTNFVSDGNEG